MNKVSNYIYDNPRAAKTVAGLSLSTGVIMVLVGGLILTAHFFPHSPLGMMGQLYLGPSLMFIGAVLSSAGFAILWISKRKGNRRFLNLDKPKTSGSVVDVADGRAWDELYTERRLREVRRIRNRKDKIKKAREKQNGLAETSCDSDKPIIHTVKADISMFTDILWMICVSPNESDIKERLDFNGYALTEIKQDQVQDWVNDKGNVLVIRDTKIKGDCTRALIVGFTKDQNDKKKLVPLVKEIKGYPEPAYPVYWESLKAEKFYGISKK